MGVTRDRPGLAFRGIRQELSAVLGSVDSRADFSFSLSYLWGNCVRSFSDRGVVGGPARSCWQAGPLVGVLDGTGSVSPCRQALFLSLLFILGKKEKKKKCQLLSEKTFMISGQGRFLRIPHSPCTLDPANIYSP